MARSTRGDEIVPAADIPAGMKAFTVVERTIKDSTGAYCAKGQQAVLNKKDATHYHKLNMIQVDLLDFDEGKHDATAKPADLASRETSPDVGAAGGEDGAEPAVDSGRGRTSRRM